MYIISITGASGSIYGVRLIEELIGRNLAVSVIMSDNGRNTLQYELRCANRGFNSITDLLAFRNISARLENITEYANNDLFVRAASGSAHFKAVIIAPCSMKTLSAIAHGYADSLITRSADVALKERRTCILVPRESPLSAIHLDNMQKVTNAGGVILPPLPGFYVFPQSIDDIVNFTVGKILNLLGIPHNLFPAWGESSQEGL